MLVLVQDLSRKGLANRLRRVCEAKRSSKGVRYQVPEALHQAWVDAKDVPGKREEMAELLAACDFERSKFIKRAVRSYVRSQSTEKILEEGWYSPDQMEKELGWSKKFVCRLSSQTLCRFRF